MMKAAVVMEKGSNPVWGQFESPVASEGKAVVRVSAAALSRLSKFRSMGMHYSSGSRFPIVAGADGVGTLEDGTRVYFAFPVEPFGSLAEQTLVDKRMMIRLPNGIDDATAAAVANPGMSSWAALVYRARFAAGQTVWINGATGASGSLAVQIARHLGAKKIVAIGRNESKLQALGADEVAVFDPAAGHDAKSFEEALMPLAAEGVDVVLDYVWGDSALAILSAVAHANAVQTTRYVSIGTASGQESVAIPSVLLRASTLELLGSGGRSVSPADMLSSAQSVFELASSGQLALAVRKFAFENIEEAWQAPLTPRPVVMIK